MEKLKKIFVCSECGYESPKWMGKCPDCGEWNTFIEDVRAEEGNSKQKTAGLCPTVSKPTLILFPNNSYCLINWRIVVV